MNKNIRLAITLSSLCLGMGLLFNHSIASVADEATSVPPAAPAKTEVPPAKKTPPEMVLLKETVAKYVIAWRNRDFKAMRLFENWEEGEELDDIKYIQSFNADFAIDEWKITRIAKGENDEYQVLVWITHNVPKDAPTFVPRNKKLRSTLVQWWKKQGGQFVHLFHIENKRLLDSLPPSPPMQSPISPVPSSPAPKTEPESAPTTPESNK
ncbi:secreted protein [Beggiatoa sp. PS]|nr:secreted protein [Beggiatoa sp. PS]